MNLFARGCKYREIKRPEREREREYGTESERERTVSLFAFKYAFVVSPTQRLEARVSIESQVVTFTLQTIFDT